mgnify:CR=1 FL=1
MNLAWGKVARDVIIVLATVLLGSFVSKFFFQGEVLYNISIIVFFCIGFAISAYLIRCENWVHLITVAIGVWLISSTYTIYPHGSFWQWGLMLIPSFVYMVIGWSVAFTALKWRNL